MRVSMREYARRRGITEGAVRKAVKQGRITKEPDGRIDIDRADDQWYANTLRPQITIPDAEMKNKPKHISELTDEIMNKILHQQPEVSATQGITYRQAKMATEILSAQKLSLQLQERKGQLIERIRVQHYMANVFKQLESAWTVWAMDVGYDIASQITYHDPHALRFALERAVQEHLLKLQSLTNKNII